MSLVFLNISDSSLPQFLNKFPVPVLQGFDALWVRLDQICDFSWWDVDNSHDDYKFVIVGMFGSIHLANERESVQESSGHYRQVNCMAILYFQKTFEFLFTTFACLVFLTCAIFQEGTAQLCDGSRLGSHHRTKQSFEFQCMFFYTAHKYLRMIGYVL